MSEGQQFNIRLIAVIAVLLRLATRERVGARNSAVKGYFH
jgi:hypothetical protein